ncbi:MAG: substrate-binding domain-containing protein [Clostridiales bacterium]|nr:substrate-binding domain-containing protein [Clostridiales bacterium]MBR6487550.1 substrate-binding domain-containing protein [Clostridiales bacterium]
MKQKTIDRNRLILVLLASTSLALFAATIIGLVYFYNRVNDYSSGGNEQINNYRYVYAFIADETDDTLSNSLYKDMVEYGKANDCFVERIGSGLTSNYSKSDLFNIAIYSKVDGIIVQGDGTKETDALIEKADQAGIPVVTVITDNNKSVRKSFIGMNDFSVGTDYGTQILNAARDSKKQAGETVSVLVLMNSQYSNQNTMLTAIQEKVATANPVGPQIKITTETITSSTAFSIQENVKDLLDGFNVLPDVIVCLSDINTRSVYQSIVESNRVGSTRILGYYDSETVTKAIERGSVFATFTVATEQMAKFCVDALNEYKEMGNVSAYFSTDYELITLDILAAKQQQGIKGKDEET